jgi:phosphopantothenoylcysteine decarboxylase/phosphopantothenate--cysteine ligase
VRDDRSPRRVILGVSGGIAAYKAVELLRLLTESGHDVRVVPTESALRFVGAPTWAALSGHPVTTEVWDDVHEVPHVRLGQQADLVVVAPATADLLARAATGSADDLLTSTLLTTRAPVLLAPAMHTEMWQHPATQDNVATLRRRGVLVLDPADGRLTGADSGPGRLPEPAEIFAVCRTLLAERALDLEGRHVVVSAGGTREHLDPVRFLGNRSSGRQGYALAATALARGAEVTLVSANVALPDPVGAKVVRVVSAEQLRDAVLSAAGSGEFGQADAVVMAAAVADFRPRDQQDTKIKKAAGEPDPIVLVRNPDVLAELAARPHAGQVLVGFAAETGEGAIAYGREKLERKRLDAIVINDVADQAIGFDSADNEVTVITADGAELELERAGKDVIADGVLSRIDQLLTHGGREDSAAGAGPYRTTGV